MTLNKEGCLFMVTMARKLVMWDVAVLVLFGLLVSSAKASVSYDSKAIIINGQRRILISGSIHYPRSSSEVLSKCAYYFLIFCHFFLSLVAFLQLGTSSISIPFRLLIVF